ncbi:Uma2 family endonuclease [Pseudoflavonifractor capillosus]|uniref:Uma2 family endonuclease n=1 Tax=Pseudoflavonifractor capillosus TaxID=106588 RepID=A0A921STP0_9FIRM|nr:Uma2 family endonuclease [Pseudoflavonifractor capillosus]HJG87487.1 Uma2 family endonuclease [Pseudoflavonifractor capillosus]
MPLPKEERYTLADVLTWDEQERAELIDGALVMMAPPSRIHQKISAELGRQLGNYLEGKKCEVYAAPFAVRLFEKAGDRPEDVDTLVEPDLSVICDPGKLDDMGCKGAPDLIIEILSPSTQRHDRLTKYNLYQRAGVREYWIVDPAARSIQSFVLEDGHYTAAGFGSPGDVLKVNVLEGCFIELSKVFPDK